ncbi:Golgi-associated RAB2 interactor protein 5B-like [Macrobrachium nipponense]|uniref:Golgi-associated RAB2 interactor protein 5B-like n=1 Tax=Macrobrachium nipponense TaxID=159736 RepID=UPI0030C83F7F
MRRKAPEVRRKVTEDPGTLVARRKAPGAPEMRRKAPQVMEMRRKAPEKPEAAERKHLTPGEPRAPERKRRAPEMRRTPMVPHRLGRSPCQVAVGVATSPLHSRERSPPVAHTSPNKTQPDLEDVSDSEKTRGQLVKDISHTLTEKATQDLLVHSAKKPRPAASVSKREPDLPNSPFKVETFSQSPKEERRREKRKIFHQSSKEEC